MARKKPVGPPHGWLTVAEYARQRERHYDAILRLVKLKCPDDRQYRDDSQKRSKLFIDPAWMDEYLATKHAPGGGSGPRNGIMTQAEFANAAGVSMRWVTELKRKGEITEFTPAQAALIKATRLRSADTSEADASLEDTLLAHKAKRLDLQAKAQITQHKLALALGNAYQAQDVERILGQLAAAVKAEINALPTHLAPRITALMPASLTQEQRNKLASEVARMCIEYAREAIGRLKDPVDELRQQTTNS